MRDHGRAVHTRVGSTIRQLRLFRGWSQEALAERANISPKHVGRIERGQVDVGLHGLVDLAAALRVDVAQLFAGTRARRFSRTALHVVVLSGDDLAQLERSGEIARRISSDRPRRSSRSSR